MLQTLQRAGGRPRQYDADAHQVVGNRNHPEPSEVLARDDGLRLYRKAVVIFDELLPSYREVQGIGRALERMAARVTRSNPLAGGESELVRNYNGFHEDFRQFMPSVQNFVQTIVGLI